MKTAPRIVAILLALSLAMPPGSPCSPSPERANPAWALRSLQPTQNVGLEEELTRSLGYPAAGLEERPGRPKYTAFSEVQRDYDRVMTFADRIAFGKAEVKSAEGKVLRTERNDYYGEAIWAAWTAVELSLSQVQSFPSYGEEIQGLLYKTLAELARYYKAHYGEYGKTAYLPEQDIVGRIEAEGITPPAEVSWLDLFGNPLTWGEVRFLAKQRKIAFAVEGIAQRDKKPVMVIFEKPEHLMERVQKGWVLPGQNRLGGNLDSIGAKILSAGEKGKAFEHVLEGRQGAQRRFVQKERQASYLSSEEWSAYLKTELIYRSDRPDPHLNNLRFIRHRLATHPQRATFPKAEVIRFLAENFGLPRTNNDEAARGHLEKVRRITPDHPFATTGDADTLISEVAFFLDQYPDFKSRPQDAAREILSRIDGNEPWGGTLAKAVLFAVEQTLASVAPQEIQKETLKRFRGTAIDTPAGLEEGLEILKLEDLISRYGRQMTQQQAIQVQEFIPREGVQATVVDVEGTVATLHIQSSHLFQVVQEHLPNPPPGVFFQKILLPETEEEWAVFRWQELGLILENAMEDSLPEDRNPLKLTKLSIHPLEKVVSALDPIYLLSRIFRSRLGIPESNRMGEFLFVDAQGRARLVLLSA